MSAQPLVRVKLKLDFGGLSAPLGKALKPDEAFDLRGLRLGSHVEEGRLVIDIECSRGIQSTIETLDDLFTAISVAEGILELGLKDVAK